MPEGRGSLIDDLRTIRRNLQLAIEGATYLSRKLHGPGPKDANDAKLSGSENVSVLLADIRRHSEVLIQVLNEHHDFVGTIESDSPGAVAMPTQSRY